ncbi:hypothetical protein HDU67_005094 [Dinochytrium kinnereticum]|nr:hypothetical protein HDU67_005094 [Dinochytrium kinnereticum]
MYKITKLIIIVFQSQHSASKPGKAPTRQATLFEFGHSGIALQPACREPKVLRDDYFNYDNDANDGHVQKLHEIDMEAAKTWLFPTNQVMRDYQFNICERCLFSNTLVALPTGLGKTFIAAVVIFNYFRWFPNGKIVFMAPTKPLVAQQIEACQTITGISQDVMDILTGTSSPELRRLSWMNKRVFFLTPQVFQNDLASKACPASKVVLVVVDEAHRALGDHAYCMTVKALRKTTLHFRILALTATPGSDTQTVQKVLENLCISRVELRTEDSPDIAQFTHKRAQEAITVQPSDEIRALSELFSKMVGIYLGRLISAKVFFEKDPCRISRYQLITAREKFRERNFPQKQKYRIEDDFAICMSLCDALTHLLQFGIRTFLKKLEKFIADHERNSRSQGCAELINNREFKEMMSNLRLMITLPNFISHPKLERLMEIVLSHLANHEEQTEDGTPNTRIMIFSQYRDSVEEIVDVLSKHEPLVRATCFIGQGSGKKGSMKGQTQKEQLEVIKKFQSGAFNTVVATCIGEEGLDIGEVDLIICFDSQNSPIRMLQRMGRTGRKREGRVVLLLSEGKEEESQKRAQAQYKAIQKAIASEKFRLFGQDMFNLLPKGCKPVCVKQNFEPAPSIETGSKKALKSRANDKGKGRPDKNGTFPGKKSLLSEAEREEYERKYRMPTRPRLGDVSVSKYTHWQAVDFPIAAVSKSFRSQDLVQLMQLFHSLAQDEESKRPDVHSENLIARHLDVTDKYHIDRGLLLRMKSRAKVAPLKSPIQNNLSDESVLEERNQSRMLQENTVEKPGPEIGERGEDRVQKRRTIKDLSNITMAISDDEDFQDVADLVFSNSSSDPSRPDTPFRNDRGENAFDFDVLNDGFVGCLLEDDQRPPGKFPTEADSVILGVSELTTGKTCTNSATIIVPMSPILSQRSIGSEDITFIPNSPTNSEHRDLVEADGDARPLLLIENSSFWPFKEKTKRAPEYSSWPLLSDEASMRASPIASNDALKSKLFQKLPEKPLPEAVDGKCVDFNVVSKDLGQEYFSINMAPRKEELVTKRQKSPEIREQPLAETVYEEHLKSVIARQIEEISTGGQPALCQSLKRPFFKDVGDADFESDNAQGVVEEFIEKRQKAVTFSTDPTPKRISRSVEGKGPTPTATKFSFDADETPLITRRKGAKRLILNSSSPVHVPKCDDINKGDFRSAKPTPDFEDRSVKSQFRQLFEANSSPSGIVKPDLETEEIMGETPEFARILRRKREPKKRKAPRERGIIESSEENENILEREDISSKRARPKPKRPRKLHPAVKAFIELEADLSGDDGGSGDEVIDGDIDCDLSGFIVHDNEISAASTQVTGIVSKALGSSPEISMYQRALLQARLDAARLSIPSKDRMRKRGREEWEGEATQWGEGAEASEYYDDDDLADFVVDDETGDRSSDYYTSSHIERHEESGPMERGVILEVSHQTHTEDDKYAKLLEGIDWSDVSDGFEDSK